MRSVLRPLRFLVACCFSVLLLLSSVAPSLAAPMKNEPNPSANAAAKEYEQAGRDSLEMGHPGPTLKEAQEKTSGGGLNEVQGTAGLDEMKRPSNSGGLPTVEKQIKKALEKVEGVD
jgi:hypothetical protein